MICEKKIIAYDFAQDRCPTPLCWLGFCQLDTSYSHLKGGNLDWENASVRLSFRQACRVFSLWLMLEGPAPELMVLSAIIKKPEQASKQPYFTASKLASRFPPSLKVPTLVYFSGLWVRICKPFPPKFAFGQGVFFHNRNHKETTYSQVLERW